MSIESDFYTLLTGSAQLVALVGDRIAQNAVPVIAPGNEGPVVVFSAAHDYDRALDGTLLTDVCTLSVQCWADDALLADQVADQVEAAIAAAAESGSADACTLGRATAYSEELLQDGTVLTIEWAA